MKKKPASALAAKQLRRQRALARLDRLTEFGLPSGFDWSLSNITDRTTVELERFVDAIRSCYQALHRS